MKNTSELTILLPVFNGEIDQINLAVQSILDQTYSNFDIIIIDDGSDSPVADFLLSLKNKDARISLVRNEINIGLSRSLNKCIANCDTKYIARMDADDWSFPFRLEYQMQFLKTHPNISVLGTEAIFMDEDRKLTRLNVKSHKDICCCLPFFCCIAHPTVIFQKSAIDKVGGYPIKKAAQDYALWAKIAFCSDLEMAILPKVCLKYRRSISQIKYGNKQQESALETRNFIAKSIGIQNPVLWNSDLTFETYRLAQQQINKLYDELYRRFGRNDILSYNINEAKLNLLINAFKKGIVRGIKYTLMKKYTRLQLSYYKRRAFSK